MMISGSEAGIEIPNDLDFDWGIEHDHEYCRWMRSIGLDEAYIKEAVMHYQPPTLAEKLKKVKGEK